MEDLKTNYLDDILSASMGGKRKFRLTKADGSMEEVTIEDISEYEQVGSTFGAGDLNNICDTVNNKFDSDDVVDPMLATAEGFAADAKLTGEVLSELNSKIPFSFGVDGDGNYGYYGADDSLIPFKQIPDANTVFVSWSNSNPYTYMPDWEHYKKIALFVRHKSSSCMAYVYENGINEKVFSTWNSGANVFDVTFNGDGTLKISTTAGDCTGLAIVPTN